MIDHELITRKLALIMADLTALAPFAGKPLDEYLIGQVGEAVTGRYLERVVGRMIDVNFHLITEADHPPPSDYYQSFTQLGTLGILPPLLARQIAACAGPRSRLVHEYDAIDPVRVHEAGASAIRDVPDYAWRVARRLRRGRTC